MKRSCRWALGVLVGVLLLVGVGAAEAQPFAYFGDRGPAHWGDLSPAYTACSAGAAQSPVDFGRVTLLSTRHRDLSVHYGETSGYIFNNGYTVEVETEGENELELDGETFRLVQFHFHNPSEHRFAGAGADMELHLVHRSDRGTLAVIGVLLTRGATSGPLSAVFDYLPSHVGVSERLPQGFNPAGFLPRSAVNYRYGGSLTTPPCTEGVRWVVMAEGLTVSDEDMARFAAQVTFNARPVQRRSR